jgi:hypothetical protein
MELSHSFLSFSNMSHLTLICPSSSPSLPSASSP